jgi:hypothetical protein
LLEISLNWFLENWTLDPHLKWALVLRGPPKDVGGLSINEYFYGSPQSNLTKSSTSVGGRGEENTKWVLLRLVGKRLCISVGFWYKILTWTWNQCVNDR